MPGCTETRTELTHIIPWSKVLKHDANNLIALCPNDHDRFDAGEVPVIAIRHIKQNQALISGRYSELELRVLQFFGDHSGEHRICLDWSMGLLYQRLLDDGLLAPAAEDHEPAMRVNWTDGDDDPDAAIIFSVPMGPRLLNLTDAGRDLSIASTPRNLHYNYHRRHTAIGDKPPAAACPKRVTNVMASYT